MNPFFFFKSVVRMQQIPALALGVVFVCGCFFFVVFSLFVCFESTLSVCLSVVRSVAAYSQTAAAAASGTHSVLRFAVSTATQVTHNITSATKHPSVRVHDPLIPLSRDGGCFLQSDLKEKFRVFFFCFLFIFYSKVLVMKLDPS